MKKILLTLIGISFFAGHLTYAEWGSPFEHFTINFSSSGKNGFKKKCVKKTRRDRSGYSKNDQPYGNMKASKVIKNGNMIRATVKQDIVIKSGEARVSIGNGACELIVAKPLPYDSVVKSGTAFLLNRFIFSYETLSSALLSLSPENHSLVGISYYRGGGTSRKRNCRTPLRSYTLGELKELCGLNFEVVKVDLPEYK